MFDDFDFDLSDVDINASCFPEGGEEQYTKTVLVSSGRSALIKAEWSTLAGKYEISFETGYSMNTTNTVFSVGDIRSIFRAVGELCFELNAVLKVNTFACVPTCSKRGRVYVSFLKLSGFEVIEGNSIITFKII